MIQGCCRVAKGLWMCTGVCAQSRGLELQEGNRSGGLVYPLALEGARREWMSASPASGHRQVASRNSS